MNPKWDEAKIQSYIDGKIEESSILEYKAAGSLARESKKTEEITKDVSSFANACGGIIIYGVGQFSDKEREHLAERITPVDRRELSKEWIEHIIGSIRPRVRVEIHPVSLKSGPNDVAYVVEIAQGDTAHQAGDCRYYQRQNFERPMMQDYQIRDVMSRRKHPELEVDVRIIIGKHGWKNKVWWRVRNTSDVFARHIMLILNVPLAPSGTMIAFKDAILADGEDGGQKWRLRTTNDFSEPLFPRSDISGEFYFSLGAEIKNAKGDPATASREPLSFRVFADDMPPKDGSLDTKSTISRSEYDDPNWKL